MSAPRIAHPALPLTLDRLTIRAGGQGRLLIDQLSMQVTSGQRWVVLGPNGAGKSTLLATLAGLLAPAEGAIQLGEKMLARWSAAELARERAWCPQFWLDPFPVSAWETVACAVQATHPDMSAPLMEQTARDWLDRLDVGQLADIDVRTLSGGERQRVALATAFAQGAPVLLFDEPTSHLDWSHQALLQELLKAWSAEGSALMAAVHDLNFAWNLATHVLLIDGHSRATAGPRDEVLLPEPLSQAFGVPVRIQEEGATRWFRIELSASRIAKAST